MKRTGPIFQLPACPDFGFQYMRPLCRGHMRQRRGCLRPETIAPAIRCVFSFQGLEKIRILYEKRFQLRGAPSQLFDMLQPSAAFFRPCCFDVAEN